MDLPELPPLPENPAGACEVDDGPDEASGGRVVHYEDGYSATQMIDYGAECARQAVLMAMEDCAKICDAEVVRLDRTDGKRTALVAGICAAAIRAAIPDIATKE